MIYAKEVYEHAWRQALNFDGRCPVCQATDQFQHDLALHERHLRTAPPCEHVWKVGLEGYYGCIVCVKCFTGKSALVRERRDYRGALADGRTVCVLPALFEAPGAVAPEQWHDPQYWLERVDGKQCWVEERAPTAPTGSA